MKTLFLGIISCLVLISCTKIQTTTSFEPIVPAVANDPNFRVSSFNALQTGNQIHITFSTSLEKDITEVVLMHGSNTTQFCRVKAVTDGGESVSPGTYSAVDDQPQGPITYYIVKYTTKTGEWGCSNLFQSHH